MSPTHWFLLIIYTMCSKLKMSSIRNVSYIVAFRIPAKMTIPIHFMDLTVKQQPICCHFHWISHFVSNIWWWREKPDSTHSFIHIHTSNSRMHSEWLRIEQTNIEWIVGMFVLNYIFMPSHKIVNKKLKISFWI